MLVHQDGRGGDRLGEECVEQYDGLPPAGLVRTAVRAVTGGRQDHGGPHGQSAARTDVAALAGAVLHSGQAAGAA